jgi:protein transport protein SEC31
MFALRDDKCSCMAWDDRGVLAVGNKSSLNIMSLQNSSLQTLQSVPTRPITCLEWSKASDGLLAAGTAAGSVLFWKKQQVIAGDGSKSFIKEDKIFESDPMTSLQFCPSKQNLLAVGGSEVFIMNLEVGLQKSEQSKYTFRPGKSSQEHKGGLISQVAWNPQVQYILAASSYNGIAAIWDLRHTRTLFNVHDPSALNKFKCAGLTWNPEIPTQFVLCYDDPKFNCLQIWDLRNHEFPVKELKEHHTGGITSSSWCPYDNTLLASTDRSGYTVIWNLKKSEPICYANHEVENVISGRWVPDRYGLLAVNTEDGKLEISSIYDTGLNSPEEVNTQTSADMLNQAVVPKQGYSASYAPKWLLNKSAAAMGFGNTIASFSEKDNKITLRKFSSINPAVQARTKALHHLHSNADWVAICDEFLEQVKNNEGEAIQWKLIKAKLLRDTNLEQKALGFDKALIVKETEKFTGKKRESEVAPKSWRRGSGQDSFAFAELSVLDAENFFNKAGVFGEDTTKTPEPKSSTFDFSQVITETISRNVNWDEGGEKLIKENLIIKNLECAIDCALQSGRTAEALIIASHGSNDLFQRTKNNILSMSKDPFLKTTFLHLINHDISEVVVRSELEKWKETLAFIVTYGAESNSTFARQLGQRISNELGGCWQALACFIVGEAFEAALELWVEAAKSRTQRNPENKFLEVQYLYFKSLALKEALRVSENERYEQIIGEYVKELQAQSLFEEGLAILARTPPAKYERKLLVLAERSFANAGEQKLRAPWESVKVIPIKRRAAKTPAAPASDKFSSSTNPFHSESYGTMNSPFPKIPTPLNEPPTIPRFNNPPSFPSPVQRPESVPPVPKVVPTPTIFDPSKVSKEVVQPPPVKGTAPPPPPPSVRMPEPPKPVSQLPPGHPITPPPFGVPVNEPSPLRPMPPPMPTATPYVSNPPPVKNVAPPPVVMQPPVMAPHPVQPPVQTHSQTVPQPTTHANPPPPPKAVPFKQPPKAIPVARPPGQAVAESSPGSGFDVNTLPREYQGVASIWISAMKEVEPRLNPRAQKYVENNMSKLYERLINRSLSPAIYESVSQMSSAYASGDIASAMSLQIKLSSESSEDVAWLSAVKLILQHKQ